MRLFKKIIGTPFTLLVAVLLAAILDDVGVGGPFPHCFAPCFRAIFLAKFLASCLDKIPLCRFVSCYLEDFNSIVPCFFFHYICATVNRY